MRIIGFLLALSLMASAQQNWTMLPSTPTITANAGKYDSFGVPGLVRTNSGQILSFYREGASHIGGRGTWQLRTSTNNGSTWTAYAGTNYCAAGDPAGCLFAGPVSTTIDVREIAGGVMPDGSISVILFYYNAALDVSNTGYVSGFNAYSRSTDDGVSWSAPVMLNTLGGSTCAYNSASPTGTCFYGVPYGQPIAANGGVALNLLQFNSSGTYPGNNTLWLVWSYDNGATWGVTQDATHLGYTQIQGSGFGPAFSLDQEERAVLCVGGKLVGLARGGFNSTLGAFGGSFWYFTSSDCTGNAAWTIANSINLPTHAIPAFWTAQGYNTIVSDLDYSPYMIDPGLPDGKVTVIFPERLTITNGTLNKTAVFLRQMTFDASTVTANAFPGAQDLVEVDSEASEADFGYSSQIVLPSGQMLIQYNDEPADHTALAQLWTMTAQYFCGGSRVCGFGNVTFAGGTSIQ